jgi:hypothetical protein
LVHGRFAVESAEIDEQVERGQSGHRGEEDGDEHGLAQRSFLEGVDDFLNFGRLVVDHEIERFFLSAESGGVDGEAAVIASVAGRRKRWRRRRPAG